MKTKEIVGFRDKEYLIFVSGKPCIVDGMPGQAHHYGNQSDGRGTGHKATDQKLVPLCVDHHREVERLGRKKFEKKHAVDFDSFSKLYHILYAERKQLDGSDNQRN
ncbi:MAG: hypothetical protein V1799_07860 [bacterium]